MTSFLLLVFALSWRFCQSVTDLHILTLVPFDGEWGGGLSLLISSGIALDEINERSDILPGYRLKMTWNNTKCNPGVGVNAMYSQLYAPPTKIIVLGGACSDVSEVTASASHLWNMVQMSAVSASPSLSDKSKFPNFFRIQPPEIQVNLGRMDIFKFFGWSKIATIHSPSNLFSVGTERLIEDMSRANMTLIRSEIVSHSPASQIKHLKDSDVRILVGSFYEPVARQVFCEAYKVGLYGPKIVWIINGWYDKNWWYAKEDTDCTVDQLSEAVEGYFTVDRLYLNPKKQLTVSGLTSQQYYAIYQNRTNYTDLSGAKMSPMAYDAAWAIGLALNDTMTKLAENGNSKRLEDFTYDDAEMGKMMRQSMQDLNFVGVKGHISFDENGDPVGTFSINRRQGGKIPRDSVTLIHTTKRLTFSLYTVICVISGLGICMTFLFLIFNVSYRHTRIVKMSSPKLNNITLMGCVLLYCTVVLMQPDRSVCMHVCIMTKVLLLTIGFSLVFGALFAKTWRVHVIFINPTKQRIIVKDSQLILMVAALAVVNVIVIIIWNVVDAMDVVIVNLPSEIDASKDTEIRSKMEICESPKQIYFMATLFIIQGILMFLGTFLAWETRNVSMDGLNDSKMIGICIYNVVVLSFLNVCISMTISNIDLKYGLTSVIVIIGTTVTQCLIVIPKSEKRIKELEEQLKGTVELSLSVPGGELWIARSLLWVRNGLEVTLRFLETSQEGPTMSEQRREVTEKAQFSPFKVSCHTRTPFTLLRLATIS
ncbi:gamma-aminobutyric acid type B receptor subunit 1-like [Gigantopelta aegis]|uniref:gamma-aminobutyric acid type B receptor subunit 1-like n=1 Tax=Gigantopelta aegis TaxID=1735272 RepID=UPI001B888288|nr:gamma-aminobutyric acid type B receptor subunit 1-like [Gigantopelta aegis]